MKDNNLLDYGSVITEKEVHSVIDVEYPETGTREEYKSLDLLVLSVTDYVRNILLGDGKAFTSVMGDYRIPLPSETIKYIERYMSSADKKLRRALKLSKNAPFNTSTNEVNTKIIMKRNSVKKHSQRRDDLL